MKKILLAGLAIGLFLVGVSGVASATTIDFEDHGANYSPIGSYYIASGVIFGADWNWYAGDPNYPAHSGSYTAIPQDYNSKGQIAPLDASISFVSPVSQVSAYFNVYAYPVTWAAYDSTGNLLGSITIPNTMQPTPGGMQEYSLPYDGISSLVFTAGLSDYSNMDDLSFNGGSTAPVPEPATLLLFGTGIAGLAAVVRRKRS